jgi:serine/threonine-protein kinase
LEKDPKRRLRDIGDAMRLLEDAPVALAQKRTLPWVAAGILGLALIVVSVLFWRATRPISQPLVRLSVDLPEFAVTPDTAPGAGVTLSPDGRRLVYTGRGTDGTFRLFTRTLDQPQAMPMAGTEDAYGPFFSPDGQAVGFFANGKLKKISVDRGVPVVLCDAAQGNGASWGEDGNIIAALNDSTVLTRIPAGGGSGQPVTEFKSESGENGHVWPQVLPGAQAMLFTMFPGAGTFEEATIETQSLRTGQRKPSCVVAHTGVTCRQGICCTCTREHSMQRRWM